MLGITMCNYSTVYIVVEIIVSMTRYYELQCVDTLKPVDVPDMFES